MRALSCEKRYVYTNVKHVINTYTRMYIIIIHIYTHIYAVLAYMQQSPAQHIDVTTSVPCVCVCVYVSEDRTKVKCHIETDFAFIQTTNTDFAALVL